MLATPFIQFYLPNGEILNLDIDSNGFSMRGNKIFEIRGIYRKSPEVTLIGNDFIKVFKFVGIQDLDKAITFKIAELEFKLSVINGSLTLMNNSQTNRMYIIKEILNFLPNDFSRFILAKSTITSEIFRPNSPIEEIEVISL